MQATRETIQIGAIRVDFLVESADSDGSVTVFTCTVPAGAKVPVPHSHDAFEETIVGLEGTCTWTVAGAVRDLAPGDALCIRRGEVHGFHNSGDTDTRFLAIATPGVFGPRYFEDLRAVLTAGGAPDPVAIGEVMARHGLTPAPPAA